MKLYMNKLTPYEHHEIFNYPQIYFIGANAKKRPGIIGGPNNCGYDDDQVGKLIKLCLFTALRKCGDNGFVSRKGMQYRT